MPTRKPGLCSILGLILATGVLAAPQDNPTPVVEQDGISVYFSPAGGCTEAIVREIAAAKESIQVLAYAFTSTPIAKALVEAHQRGVKVTVVLDRKENAGAQYSGATYLANQGLPVFLDGKHPIAHNKVMVLDGATVITGSFNFSKAAEESNAENLLVIRGKPKIAEAYARNFQEHLAHAVAYQQEKGEKTEAAKPVGLDQLVAAGRRYVDVPGKPTEAAEKLRHEKILKELVGQKVQLLGTLQNVVGDDPQKLIASVSYESKRQVKYKTTVNAGGFYGGTEVERTEPAEAVTITVATSDGDVANLSKQSAVSVTGVVTEISFSGGGKMGLKISLVLEDGKVEKR